MRRDPPSRVTSFGVGASATSATAGERNIAAAGELDRQPSQREEIAPHPRLAPDDDVEDLLLVEDLPDLRPAQHRGDRVAHGGARHAELLGPLRPELHLNLRDEGQGLHLDIGGAVDGGDHLPDLGRLLSQHVEIGPKMRTTIVALAPVSTSLIRSRR